MSVALGALRPRSLAASERVWSVVMTGVAGRLSGGGPSAVVVTAVAGGHSGGGSSTEVVVAVVVAGGISGGGPSILAGGLFCRLSLPPTRVVTQASPPVL